MGIEAANAAYGGQSSEYGNTVSATGLMSRTESMSRGKGTRNAPIDLCDSPPPRKMRGAKRKITDDAGFEGTMRENPSTKKARAQGEGEEKPAKKSKAKSNEEEKRLKRFRSHAPSSYSDIRHRALTQRMFVIDRKRTEHKQDVGSLVAHTTEIVSMAGTTGNIYTIVIDKVPSCDCPHALKGNNCKHVVYVLARVLRAPDHLQYQSALLSTELQQIFDEAPPLPSETADDSAKDGKRKPIEGDCPICCVDFEPGNRTEEIVYCKASCGNNIHKTCFDQWAKTKRGGTVTCPFCRSLWEGSDEEALKRMAETGAVNEDGYVNVASHLGLSGERDYSTYNEFWVRRQGYGRYWD